MTPTFPSIFAGMAVVATLLGGVPALAQTRAIDSGSAPALTLSSEQKQTIYQSVSVTQKNNAAPTGFRAAVGAQVPDSIELNPMPQALATLIPELKDLQVAMVEKQVVLVDANSKLVVAVFAHGQ
jgi:hypothetical protein